MDIPEQVKIRGQQVRVTASPRGYVTVGKYSVSMSVEKVQEMQVAYNEKKWQQYMYELFVAALAQERHRMKNGTK